MPVFPVLDYLPEFAQTHVHCVNEAIQPSHPLLSPSTPAFDLSQSQGRGYTPGLINLDEQRFAAEGITPRPDAQLPEHQD